MDASAAASSQSHRIARNEVPFISSFRLQLSCALFLHIVLTRAVHHQGFSLFELRSLCGRLQCGVAGVYLRYHFVYFDVIIQAPSTECADLMIRVLRNAGISFTFCFSCILRQYFYSVLRRNEINRRQFLFFGPSCNYVSEFLMRLRVFIV